MQAASGSYCCAVGRALVAAGDYRTEDGEIYANIFVLSFSGAPLYILPIAQQKQQQQQHRQSRQKVVCQFEILITFERNKLSSFG